MRREILEKRRFKAVADNGTEFVIVEYATVREERDMHGVQFVENKVRDLLTTEGDHVNPVGEGVFEVLTRSGVIRVRVVDGGTGNSDQ